MVLYSDFDKDGEKMNKKLLTIAIALVLFAIVAAPVAGIITVSNKDLSGPNGQIWKAIKDLQTQITTNLGNLQSQITALVGTDNTQNSKIAALEEKVADLEAAPGVHFGESQKIIVNPGTQMYISPPAETDGFVFFYCSNSQHETSISMTENPGLSVMTAAEYSPMNSNGYSYASINMPVKQGHIWHVDWDYCNIDIQLNWIPLSA
jgi:hypothetical protein